MEHTTHVQMVFRTLTSYDRSAVMVFYLGLSADDRRKRFCSMVSDASIARYVNGLDLTSHTIIGALDQRGALLGIAELAPGEKSSEMAFSVRPDMRWRGIGTQLMQRLLRHARMSGIANVHVFFLPDNKPMRKLAHRAGLQVETHDGESFAKCVLPPPTIAELSHWLANDALAAGGYVSLAGIARWTSPANWPAFTPA